MGGLEGLLLRVWGPGKGWVWVVGVERARCMVVVVVVVVGGGGVDYTGWTVVAGGGWWLVGVGGVVGGGGRDVGAFAVEGSRFGA